MDELFAPDAAATIADAISRYGYRLEGEEMYRAILMETVKVDQALLDCVPDKHRSGLLEYWSSVNPLARRQGTSSLAVTTTTITKFISPTTTTKTPSSTIPTTPTTFSVAPKTPKSVTTDTILVPPIARTNSTIPTLTTSQAAIGSSRSALRTSPSSLAPTGGSSQTVSTVPQTNGAATTPSTGGASSLGGLPRGAKIGIAVAAPVIIILLAGIAILLWMNRRYKRKLGLPRHNDKLPIERGSSVAEVMSQEVKGPQHPSNIPEMDGAGTLHSWFPSQKSELRDTSRAEVAATPATHGESFLNTGTSELPAGGPTQNFEAQNPSDTLKEATTSSGCLSWKPPSSTEHADPPQLQADRGNTAGPLSERESQIRELEEQRQKLGAEQQALQERLSRLRA
ncbi:hypothetical protein FGG08_004408 [Glutinoglossum americanum]|uniref:Uncharacterized protein n=1 Tax=Glutinoglossum americanum TaxID=1670608 RepID=A0A9P8I2E1_9PEZI|nr:hypothetical protein FGG08_004408 [Glutinoglossum americanum]